jgi:signal transduction histidine kinase
LLHQEACAGLLIGWSVHVQRESDREVAESRHSCAVEEMQPVLDAMPFYALLVDSCHRIIAVNDLARRDFELNPAHVIGAYCPLVIHDRPIPIEECPLTEAVLKGESVQREVFNARNSQWMKLAVFPTSMVTKEGKPIYLHFARDITQARQTADDLSRSLEHNRALCSLLQNLQYCQNSSQVLETLIDGVISLSWLGMTATAAGFLAKEQGLEMVAQRNLNPMQQKRCKRLALGECLCGKVAETGSHVVCSSSEKEHSIQYEGMGEHRHAVLPISHEGRVLGVLTLYLNSPEVLNSFRLDFLKAATAAAGTTLAGQLARESTRRIREKFRAKMIAYQEGERKRIAEELHDQVCQSLSALLLEVQSHVSQYEFLKDVAQGCEARIRGLIDEVRQMAVQLRPAILDDYGLEQALSRHIKELSSSHPELTIDFQYASPQPDMRLSAPIEVGLYRVAMEALSNIVSHASASRASVIFLWQKNKILLLVEDDGCGFDYTTSRRDADRCLGLLDMEERVALLGGTLRVESVVGEGTVIRAEIPIQ